jgi:hypothetical protein
MPGTAGEVLIGMGTALLCLCSADQTRWYRDANGNFFVPVPTKRDEDLDAADPLGR